MVDHITEWKPHEFIKGVKNIAMSEDVLEFHFPKNPIMPGVLLLEALVQLAGWLEAVSSNFESWFLVSRVSKCNFYGFALPGDQVELEVENIPQEKTQRKVYRGRGRVKGKKKVTADFEGEIIPLSDVEHPEEQKALFERLIQE